MRGPKYIVSLKLAEKERQRATKLMMSQMAQPAAHHMVGMEVSLGEWAEAAAVPPPRGHT